MYTNINTEGRYFLHLLGCILNNIQPTELPEGLDFEKVYSLAEKHSAGSLTFSAVKKLSAQPGKELLSRWSEISDKEFCRDIIQRTEYAALCRSLKARKIRFLPLKGILLKELYPKPFMRTMSDIDLLIDPENADKVREIMLSLGYTVKSFGAGNEDCYHKPPLMSVEIHRSFFSPEDMEGLSGRHFGDPWAHSRITSEGTAELSVNFFFGYILAHAARHYSDMGTGVKHFMDIYLLWQKYGSLIDLSVLDKLMNRENAALCRDMLRLSVQWFGDTEPDGSLSYMEERVLGSGTYGTLQNSLDQKLDKRGKVGYILYELFIPADRIIYDYPVLNEKPYLLPFVRVKRIYDKTVGDPKLVKMNLRTLLKK